MMLLSFQAKKEAKYRGVHRGGHFDQKSVALRNCVYPLQGQIDRAQLVGVRRANFTFDIPGPAKVAVTSSRQLIASTICCAFSGD